MPFHKHYFDMKGKSPYAGVTTTLSCPHVRIIGDVAVIAYVRLTQRASDGGHQPDIDQSRNKSLAASRRQLASRPLSSFVTSRAGAVTTEWN